MAGKRGNNEGSITKRKDGRWMARVSLSNGKRKSLYGRTRDEVAKKLTIEMGDKDKGLLSLDQRKTLGAYLTDWLPAVEPTVRRGIFERYTQYVERHIIPELGKKSLARLTPVQLQSFYAKKLTEPRSPKRPPLSPTTVAHIHTVLHTALEQALRWGQVARNVAALVDPPRSPRKDMVTLSGEQSRKFLKTAAGTRFEALYTLALTSGMRQGELFALRWSSVDLDQGALQVTASVRRVKGGFIFSEPKTKRSRRQISLSTTAVDALKRHRVEQNTERLQLGPDWEDLDLVFANEVGRPVEPQNLLRRSFHPLLTKAQLPTIRFHDLRHTAATLLLGQGMHPKIVSEMLGHSSVAITLDLYSHVTPTMQRQAAQAMDEVLGG